MRRRDFISLLGGAATSRRARNSLHGYLAIRIQDGEFGMHKC